MAAITTGRAKARQKAAGLKTMKVETGAFSRRISKMIKEYNLDAAWFVRSAAMQALKGFMEMNPVDTGRSRAAWFVAAEKLGVSTSGLKKPPRHDPKAEADGKSRGDFEDHLGDRKHPHVILINGVEYILGLEYGRSMQAPYGMVRVTLQGLTKTQSDELKRKLKRRTQDRWAKIKATTK